MYIYERPDWPQFIWHADRLEVLLGNVRHQQGRLLGQMQHLGFGVRTEAAVQALTQEVVKSHEIEGERLDAVQVRSSVARRLGLATAGLEPASRHIDGVVATALDAVQGYAQRLTAERLLGWQSALFPEGRSSFYQVRAGAWRDDHTGPMQVVSGTLGREKVHFQAPAAAGLDEAVQRFLTWFNDGPALDAVLKAGVAHLWFVTLHPFEDGNGRIVRTITDLQLARADGSSQRFYSLSAQILRERKEYYHLLEKTQKASLDITAWLEWFLECLGRALTSSEHTVAAVLRKAHFWEQLAGQPLNERQRKLLNQLLDGFEGKLTSSKWATIAKCSQDTASRDIASLLEADILLKDPAGGRSTSYRLS